MKILRFIVLLIAVLGLFITLGSNLSWFKDKDRIDFYNTINKDRKSPPDTPGAQKFLKSYLYSLPITAEEKNKVVKELRFVGIYEKTVFQDNRLPIYSDVMTGYVVSVTEDNEISKKLSSIEELKNWSEEPSNSWKWCGLLIMAVSIFFEIIIFIVDNLVKKNDNLT